MDLYTISNTRELEDTSLATRAGIEGGRFFQEQPTEIGDLGAVAALVAVVMLQQHVAAFQICVPDSGAVSNCPASAQ